MLRDQVCDTDGRDVGQQLERPVAPRVRGARRVRDADASGAPGAPGGGGEAARPASKAAARDHSAHPLGTQARREERDGLILAALPGGIDKVAEATGIPKSTVWRLLQELHRDSKIHVIAWVQRPNGGKPNPTYAAGPGEDATYQVKTMAERAKERRIREALEAQSEPEERRWLSPHARRRALAEVDLMVKTRDPMIEALFGPAKRPTT